MMQLEFRTPPAFHVQPFVAEPDAAKRAGWLRYVLVAVVAVALLNVAVLSARSATRPGGTGITSALGDWVAGLDEPELSQSSLEQQ
jgi:hypothetical protein